MLKVGGVVVEHPRILIQLDSDPHPSVFDAVVAVDSRVDHLLQYSDVEPTNAQQLVHGAMFTRGPEQLCNTAIFVGGSNVAVGDAVGEEIKQAFFGPIRVSVMLDGNGSNTTASAAVVCVGRHVELSQVNALVLGGTGPVGQRVARLLLGQGGRVCLASRNQSRANSARESLVRMLGDDVEDRLEAMGFSDTQNLRTSLSQRNVVFSCGAAGVQLLPAEILSSCKSIKVAVDLNAVPPSGIEGISATDKAVSRGGRIDYGAIGVGGLKMKIHRRAIETLFTSNDLFLDTEQIFEIGCNLEAAKSTVNA